MLIYHHRAYFLTVLLVSYPALSAAVNFSQCLRDVIDCANNQDDSSTCSLNISNKVALSLLRTSKGAPVVTTDTATSISYQGCINYCGGGQESFSWTGFSQEYSQWLLPYLALLSQLPFGARRRLDNLMSMILTLGSPTLAGYSLYLSLLNSRWVDVQLFSGFDYPNAEVRQSVVRVLSSLQQVPLRVHPGDSARFESLIIHPDNDNWWRTLAEDLNYSHTWSIASATSIAWVLIAYLLTVADSLSSVVEYINSNGQGTGSVWIWLLPIVMGWLILSPKCDEKRVQEVFNKAKQLCITDSSDSTTPPALVTYNLGLTISPGSCRENITSPDEARIPPVFYYAKALSWSRTVYITSLYYRAARRKLNRRLRVDGRPIPENVGDSAPRECRLGNRDQIIYYCQPDRHEYSEVNVLWPPGVFFNMIIASLMALQLQWGTTLAAVLAAWFTPTTGLGCRSLAYMIYGMLSSAVWLLLLVSSILGYSAHHLHDDFHDQDLEGDQQPFLIARVTSNRSEVSGAGGDGGIPMLPISFPEAGDNPLGHGEFACTATIKDLHTRRIHSRTIARVADLLRWIGKTIAFVNAIGIIANSVFQYASVYDNCYCDSSVYTWGLSSAFAVFSPNPSDIDLTKNAWIGALALSLSCSTFFVGTIYLLRDSAPS